MKNINKTLLRNTFTFGVFIGISVAGIYYIFVK
ncbi:hypothetical protein Bcell_0925 [Evansella cellulosilytica DSM 2522]|uniref:Uncharacterized protein n=1 Tax=Evansella cellulosilytica (strain ATCC 21833 / DSM 2522 / FERM P-1141 / JCM 9156 / N-4) TaxID=649639 RepID=E6U1F4_EVAC2|nr:hypothetical protein Bcell_0925 [Evansella cellulosilytica DSM 2522]